MGALAAVPVYLLAGEEARRGECVRRQRDGVASLGVRRPDFRATPRRMLDLRKEWLVAVACFGRLNALLAAVNAVDINWLWLDFQPGPDHNLTQFVHEGTYVLIFNILLAAGILLWFFRRSLNFYQPGLPWLRGGATLWVAQNAFLAASVGLRNYYYITAMGRAYKRIGLGTLLLKIWQRRTLFSLLQLNSWAAYALLLALAFGNWEGWIARCNLQPRFRTLDLGSLLAVLPTLVARQALIDRAAERVQQDDDGTYQPLPAARAQALLRQRVQAFRRAYAARDWQSRTGADWRAYEELNGHD